MVIVIRDILKLLGSDKKKIPLIVLLFVFGSFFDLLGLSMIVPYISLIMNQESRLEGIFSEYVIRLINIFANDEYNLILVFSYLILFLFAIKTISMLIINWVIIDFSQKQQIKLRTKLITGYTNLNYEQYLKNNSAEYIHHIHALTGQFQMMLMNIFKSLSDIFVILVIFYLLLIENIYAFSLLLTMIIIFNVIYNIFLKNKVISYGINYNIASENIIKLINEIMNGFKEIWIFGCKKYFIDEVILDINKYADNYSKYLWIQQSPRYFLEFVMISFITILVIIYNYIDINITNLVGTIGLFGVSAFRLAPIVSQLVVTNNSIRFNRDCLKRLTNDLGIIEFNNNIYQSKGSNILSDDNYIFKGIKLINCNFSYKETTREILKNINLEINAGESVGIVGVTGSGKTTLVNMMIGLLKPNNGKIEVNNKPIEDNLEDWIAHLAYIPQDVFLIDDTLKNNIALGLQEDKINDERIKVSLRQAQLVNFVEKLPNGFNTIIGERGVRLSGGQRQRIALARAFYHNRPILILDESTSALDFSTEKELIEELQCLKGRNTVISIAHRKSSLAHCDRIYKINEGNLELVNIK